jgi:hypothetical protein
VIPSIPLSVALTVLFTGTGLYSLLRWASLRVGVAGHHGDQVAELSHLVMSLAMVGMVWAYGGSFADTVQLVVFGGFSCYFLGRLVLGRLRPGCPAPGFHLLMAASMVWMVAAMPLLMAGMSSGSGGGGMVMDGHVMGGDEGASGPVVTETPGWALALTVLCCVGLLVGAGYWARQLRPSRGARADLPAVEFGNRRPVAGAEDLPAVQLGNEEPVGGRTATATATATAATAPARGRVLAALTPRADATCHLAMSLGMVAMFLVML